VALVGRIAARAITTDVAGVDLTGPWLPLGAIAGTCLALTLLAARVGEDVVA
jgi:hypothetical protein